MEIGPDSEVGTNEIGDEAVCSVVGDGLSRASQKTPKVYLRLVEV